MGLINFLGIRGIIGLAVAAFLGTMLFLSHRETTHWKDEATKFEQSWQGERAAHLQTRLNYTFARETAREADLQNKQRAEAEQRANIERQRRDYEERIARARADYQRLLDRAEARPNPGSAGAAPVPGDRASGTGTSPAPTDHGLSLDERLIATEQAIQLDELIDYVNGLLKVDLNGRAKATPERP